MAYFVFMPYKHHLPLQRIGPLYRLSDVWTGTQRVILFAFRLSFAV